MSSTKIINVLKDDSFESLIDLFKNAPAKEVIFVLPKNSRAFKKEEHFVVLENEANNLSKSASFLCSNPEVNELARIYNFDVLMPKSKRVRKEGTEPISLVTQIEDDSEDNEDYTKTDYEDYPVMPVSHRNMGDIVSLNGDEQKKVKISANREKSIDLDVSFEDLETKALDEIRKGGPRENTIDGWKDIFSSRPSESLVQIKGNPIKVTNFRRGGRKSYRKFFVGVGTAAVLVIFTLLFTYSGKARIEIKPQAQAVDFTLSVTSSDKYSSPDFSKNQIPGQLLDLSKNSTQTFTATGERDVAQKAKGIITVYNDQTSSQPLVTTTRFESPNGLIFRTLKTIAVPAGQSRGGSVTPGKIDVEVVADKAGKEYNIEASNFKIPGFKEQGFSDKYIKVYGKSSESMRGGTSGRAKYVTEADYSLAKDTVTAQVKSSIETELESEVAGLKILTDSQINFGEPKSTARVDEAADSFTVTIEGRLKSIGFKEEDLLSLLDDYVGKNNNLTVLAEDLNINYDKVQYNEVQNILNFDVVVKGQAYAKIDKNKIISDLLGSKEARIKDYLGNLSEVESAKVVLSPFWVNKVPRESDKVTIELIYK